jgi:soluble lytic murein transglycosylase-like protein
VRRGSRTPHPTLERVDGAEIAAIARANAVPATLAEAIAWQESGWNNDERSVTGAVGVMQVAPATWRWINRYLTPADPLDGSSAADNIRAGVLLLHDLLNVTGGRQRLTIAAYFQGLASVQQNGQYASTRQYVRSVLAIERQLAA